MITITISAEDSKENDKRMDRLMTLIQAIAPMFVKSFVKESKPEPSPLEPTPVGSAHVYEASGPWQAPIWATPAPMPWGAPADAPFLRPYRAQVNRQPLGFALEKIVHDGKLTRIVASARPHIPGAIERFVIPDPAGEWAVRSVRVGVMEQFVGTSPIPVQVFTQGEYTIPIMVGADVTVELVPYDDDATAGQAPCGVTAIVNRM